MTSLTPHDQARFKTFITKFVEDCEIEPPFHLVMIGSNGSVTVAQYLADSNVEPVCDHIVGGGFVAPISLTIIKPGAGVGKSAVITIETARQMQ
jgi:hypothetical protein